MGAQLRKGGTWHNLVGCAVFANGAWRTILAIKVYAGGSWRSVANFAATSGGGGTSGGGTGGGGTGGGGTGGGGTGGGGTGGGGGTSPPPVMTLTAAPNALSGEGSGGPISTGNTTATPTGGLAPYTYSWTIVSSTAGLTFNIGSPTLATTNITAFGVTTRASCTIQCVATDALGTTATSGTVAADFTQQSGRIQPI